MTHNDRGGERARGASRSSSADGHGVDIRRVLIVASSPINRIVIARTVERIYLRPEATVPDAAPGLIERHRPMVVIIDETMEPASFERLMAALERQRRASERRLPCTILIAASARQANSPHSTIDAIVAKPITPDALQPVVERLITERGG